MKRSISKSGILFAVFASFVPVSSFASGSSFIPETCKFTVKVDGETSHWNFEVRNSKITMEVAGGSSQGKEAFPIRERETFTAGSGDGAEWIEELSRRKGACDINGCSVVLAPLTAEEAGKVAQIRFFQTDDFAYVKLLGTTKKTVASYVILDDAAVRCGYVEK